MGGFGFGFRRTARRLRKAASGPSIRLSASSVLENVASGTTVGALSVVNHASGGSGWTFSISVNDDAKFAISGANLNTAGALNYEAKASYTITIQAAKSGQTTLTRSVVISVINELEVTLGALAFSSTTFPAGIPSTGTITGATTGSAIAASGLPSGLTINGAARTWSWDGSGAVGIGDFDLTETHPDASPRVTTIDYSISDEIRALFDGDSISFSPSPASYAYLWAADNPDVTFSNLAQGGAQLGNPGDVYPAQNSLYGRQAEALAWGATHLSIFIWANDFISDTAGYMSRLNAYLAPFRSAGTIITVMTGLPRAGYNETYRTNFNTAMRAAAGTMFNYLVDFDTTLMGAASAVSDNNLYSDGTHPTALGQSLLKRAFAPVFNHSMGRANEPLDFEFQPITGADLDTSYSPPEPYVVHGLYPGETRPLTADGPVLINGAGPVTSSAVQNDDEVLPILQSSEDEAVQADRSVTIGTTTAVFSVTTSGGSELWTPAALGNKLKLWVTPDSIVVGGDNGFGELQVDWTDVSGNGVNLTPAGASSHPIRAAAQLNGFDVVRLKEAYGSHFTLPNILSGVAGSAGASAFAVSKNISTNSLSPPFGDFGSDTSGEFYPHPNASTYLSFCTNTRYGPITPPTLNVWRTMSVHSKQNDWRWVVDAVARHTETSSTFAVGSSPKIGLNSSSGGAANMDIAEALVCVPMATAGEQQQIEGYLHWKYGLQANLPGGHPYAAGPPMT